LLLASGEGDPSFADEGGISHGETGDFRSYTGGIGGLEDCFVLTFFHAEGNVFAQRFAEEIRILRNKTDRTAQGSQRPFLNRSAVDQQVAARRFPQPG